MDIPFMYRTFSMYASSSRIAELTAHVLRWPDLSFSIMGVNRSFWMRKREKNASPRAAHARINLTASIERNTKQWSVQDNRLTIGWIDQ
jgi:hypothetical protein